MPIIRIRFTAGPSAGLPVEIPAGSGFCIGRSSACEIAVSDPALSRRHCLVEVRDGALWVTDLASANGTTVGGKPLGPDAVRVAPGDVVGLGDSAFVLDATAAPTPEAAPEAKVDLGLSATSSRPAPTAPRGNAVRSLLWGTAAVVLAAAAAAVILFAPENADDGAYAALPSESTGLEGVEYEKVEADVHGIYRYYLTMDAAGTLAVEIDDVPEADRHVRKSKTLTPAARESLTRLLSQKTLAALATEMPPAGTVSGELKSYRLKVAADGQVRMLLLENAAEPESFHALRTELETFSKNELGIWAIQYSADRLLEMSAEAARTADAKWEERDVTEGNLAAAIAAYDEAIADLETINPKPEGYEDLARKRREAVAELDRRYKDQRFVADRAINMGDWERAGVELRVLLEMVPDAQDKRHIEARGKLLDVEQRLKKGGK